MKENLYTRPHYHDPNRPYMSLHDRAAQFMPFKSLTSYHDLVDEKTEDILDDEWQKIIYDDEYREMRRFLGDGGDDGERSEK